MKKNLVGVSRVLGAFTLIILVAALFLYFSGINESINKGRAYNLTVGDSKEDVFHQLPEALKTIGAIESDNTIKVELFFSDRKVPDRIEQGLSNIEYQSFENSNKWRIYINSRFFFDNLTLEFCDEKLCKITRYRRYFELP